MTIYNVLLDPKRIDFHPATPADEIMQNVITICTTPKGSRPRDREFGVDPINVDLPMAKEQSRIASEIVQAVNKYEPRAHITGVDFEFQDSTMYPKIFVIVNA